MTHKMKVQSKLHITIIDYMTPQLYDAFPIDILSGVNLLPSYNYNAHNTNICRLSLSYK